MSYTAALREAEQLIARSSSWTGMTAEAVARQHREAERDGLAAMVLYAKAGGCRWAAVLAHFAEALPDGAARCGHCDSCARFEQLLASERSAPATAVSAAGRPMPEVPELPELRFAPGQRVRVRRFGWGEVQTCSDAQVRIDFPRHGVRDIHPDFVLAAAGGRAARVAR